MTLFEAFQKLDFDRSRINLEPGSETGGYFCTPVDARVIGWETGGIHYCFLPGYGEKVFAVNPMPAVERYVYPLAETFEDFLRLILACGTTTAIEQIAGWSRAQFEAFLAEDPPTPERQTALDTIRSALSLTPMEDPYASVRRVQAEFDDAGIVYSDEYYDVLGLEPPSGREPV